MARKAATLLLLGIFKTTTNESLPSSPNEDFMTNHSFAGDIFSLTKPKITLMAVMVALAGLLHAQNELYFWPAVLSLLGIAALVSGASALNMYLERDLDKRMERTKDRPLPAQRIDAFWAVLVGTVLFLAACVLLYSTSNKLTLILGILSMVLYVFCYTPLKQRTWFSLIIGSIPGAMPVALGYVSLADTIDGRALALFLWAFLWQIPHFLAISLFREKEYTKAGFPVLSACFGVNVAKNTLLITSWLLVASTLGLYWADLITLMPLILSLLLGVAFLWVCHQGAFSSPTDEWAKRAFKASLFYQSLLFLILIVSAF